MSTSSRILLASAFASLLASSVHAADLEVTVLDGGLDRPQPLSGAIAALTTASGKDATSSGLTATSGIADLTSLTAGTRVLRVTGPNGYATLDVQVELSPSSNSVIVLLPHVPEGISDTVSVASGLVQADVTIEDPLVPNARLTIAALTTLSGSTGDSELSLYPIDKALTPAPFPGELSPRRIWALQPGGLSFGGATLRLPNEEDLPAGTKSTLWSFGTLEGRWVQIGKATVDATGTFLESEGAVVTQSGYLAVDSGRPLVGAEFSLSLVGPGGAPLSGATVRLLGQKLPESSTPGTYASTAFVTTGTPVRAFVTKDFSGLRLSAMTRPVLALPFHTQLNRGQALRLGLSYESAQNLSVASFGRTGASGYSFTDFAGPVSAAPVTTITASTTYSSAAGPLEQAFPSAKPHNPLVEFALAPDDSGGAIEDRYVPFSLTVSDADLTTRGNLVQVNFNFDGSDTVFPYTATILRGDLGPYRGPAGGSNEFLFIWDRFASFPPSSTGAQDVKLQITFEDEPSGLQISLVSESFSVEYPAPLEVQRVDPNQDATGVLIDSELRVQFDQPLDPASVTTTNFKVLDVATILTSTTVTLLASADEVRITRSVDWPASRTLTVQIEASAESTSGSTLGSSSTSEFTTGTVAGLADDDGDGLLNLEEAHYGLDDYTDAPLGYTSEDWDADGVSDYDEIFVTFTDPMNPDTDRDGESDLDDDSPLVPGTGSGVAGVAPVSTQFGITTVLPGLGSTVPANTKIVVSFTAPVDTSTITVGNLTLDNVTTTTSVGLTYSKNTNPFTIVLTPNSPLTGTQDYKITLTAGTGAIADTDGNLVTTAAVSTFTVDSAPDVDAFEATHYYATLGMTHWESFALTGASGGAALVVPSTGQLVVTETDVTTPGRGLPVSISRIYRSNSKAVDGIFGKDRHFPYDERITASIATLDTDTITDYEHVSEDGRIYPYLSGGNNNVASFLSAPGRFEGLRAQQRDLGNGLGTIWYLRRRTGGGMQFFYVFPDGSGGYKRPEPTILSPGDVGRLVLIQDPNENQIRIVRFAWNQGTTAHEIEKIVDDVGRTTTFAYGDATHPTLVTKVEQFEELGSSSRRAWTYSYDANGYLQDVTTPSTEVATVTGPTVSLSNSTKTHSFAYSQSGSRYLLSSYTDGRSETTLRVFYDGDDNVCQVDYGTGSETGTALYSYVRDGTGTNTAVQVDRDGNVSELAHVANGSGFYNISESKIYTKGAHPYLTGAEPLSYTTSFVHDLQSQIVQITAPTGEVSQILRAPKEECGNCKEAVFRHATDDEIAVNPNAEISLDRVWSFGYEPGLHLPIYVREPRGNDPLFVGGTLGTAGDIAAVGTAACRTWTAVPDAGIQDTYTTRTWYDHQIVADELQDLLNNEGLEIFLSPLPISFGRTNTGNDFRDPATPFCFAGKKWAVPDDDGDGSPDRGGNPVAVRGPAPKTVSACLTVGPYFPGGQHVQTGNAFNQHGQNYFTKQPDGKTHRVEFGTGDYSDSNCSAGLPTKVVAATEFTDQDIPVATGVPTGASSGSGLELETLLTYDEFGNVLTTQDPRGNITQFEVNVLNLVTRTTATSPFSYLTEHHYDRNNNLVQRRVQNAVAWDLDDNGLQQGSLEQAESAEHPWFEHRFRYNSVNLLAESDMDAYGSSPERLVTRHVYNQKFLRIATQEPAGNVHVWRYDERDLVYEQILGSSDLATCQTIRYDYDPEGKLLQVLDDDGNLSPQVSYQYDEYDRVKRQTDELGNYTTFAYDTANNLRQRKVYDTLDTLLENTVFSYDEASRVYQVARELWNPVKKLGATGLNLTRVLPREDFTSTSFQEVPGSEFVHTLIGYRADGKVQEVCDDNAHVTRYTYDAADRVKTITDAGDSVVSYTYDLASNVIRVREDEKRSDGTGTPETYYTERFYDELNRLVAETSHSGNTSRLLYDSRSNVVQVSDAMANTVGTSLSDLPGASEHGTFPYLLNPGIGLSSSVNERGNTTRFTYDGLSRQLSKHEDLRIGGVGAGAVINAISVSTIWDANSRVSGRVDPTGNVTSYAYDHQNRQIRETFADGTNCRYAYNPNGTLALKIDPRGVTKKFTYDAIERTTDLEVLNVPMGQEQTTFSAWSYDGLSRVLKAEDNDTICESTYDSLSREASDLQRIGTGTPRSGKLGSLSGEINGKVSRAFDGVGNLKQLWYPQHHTAGTPNSVAAIQRTHDTMDRLNTVSQDGSQIATLTHIGSGGRRLKRTYTPNGGTNMTRTLTFDFERRFATIDVTRASGTPARIVGYQYTWDRADNRRTEKRLAGAVDASTVGDFYVYDSAYRLVHADRDVAGASLPVANNVASVTPPTVNPATALDYHLDTSGNRTQVSDAGTIKPFVLNIGAPTHDSVLNQYSSIAGVLRSHDTAGNVVSQGTTERFFDCDNRLVQWIGASKDVRYRYDVQGRRVSKADVAIGSAFDQVLYFYDDWQCVEEATAAGSLQKTYVFGEGIDEILKATLPDVLDLDNDAGTTEVDLFYHQNSLGSVTAVTDVDGDVVESYSYKPYGAVTIRDDSGAVVSTTQVEQPFMFTGRRWDFEEQSGLYYYRLRYYDPAAGRFVSRDPLGMWGDSSQRGNAQNYCGNNPINLTDPLGLEPGGRDQGMHSGASGQAPELQPGEAGDKARQELKEKFEAEKAKRASGKGKGDLSQREWQKLRNRHQDAFGRHHRPDQQRGQSADGKSSETQRGRRSRRGSRARNRLTKKQKRQLRDMAERVKSGQAKWLKRLGKVGRKIPGVGLFVFIIFLPSEADAKGWAGACADGALDAIPWVGTAKGAYELFTGKDLIPSLPKPGGGSNPAMDPGVDPRTVGPWIPFGPIPPDLPGGGYPADGGTIEVAPMPDWYGTGGGSSAAEPGPPPVPPSPRFGSVMTP